MTALAALVAGALLQPATVGAQGVIWATVSGAVTDVLGRPISQALVTLSSSQEVSGREATTDFTGRFAFALVAPGSYEVRAEALGYRPVVARTLTVGSGESSGLALTLAEAPPPVLTVDTVAIDPGLSARWRPGGGQLGPPDYVQLPDRFEDLSSAAALAPHSDLSMGSQGLPGTSTLVIADGVPFYRAPHPVARSESLAAPLFPLSALSGIAVLHAASDVEWNGTEGGYLVLSTRSISAGEGVDVGGSWSGDALWSSSELDFPAPGLASFRGAVRANVDLVPGESGLAFGAQGFREEVPLSPRLTEPVQATLSGIDPDLLAALSAPSTERTSSYSAFTRADVRRSETSRFFMRGLFAYTDRQFDGPGPVALTRDVALPEESVDYSFAGGLISRYGTTDLELRLGLSGSNRTFEAAGVESAYLVGSGHPLGTLAEGAGESSRFDFFVTPLVHWPVSFFVGTLKIGGAGRLTSHTMASSVPQELLFSDGAGLMAGQGFDRSLTAPKVSFSSQEISGFAQYEIEPAPGVKVTVSGRYDREFLPESDIAPNVDWRQASGVRNDSLPSDLEQWSGRGALTWDPLGDQRLQVLVSIGVHQGDVDPRVLHQALAQDVGATSALYAGSGLSWPGGALPSGATSLPTLTVASPDMRAPRSEHGSVGAVTRLFGGWSLYVEGAFRRTDFLMRRRNLNTPVAPQAADPFGREVLGTLRQDGSLVTATDPDAQRFPGFNEAWALDPDGWSEYRGATVALAHERPGSRLYAAYTRSETTDNWIGAASGAVSAEIPPLLPAGDEWSEGTSDFDAPHRVSAAGSFTFGFATAAAVYHYRSGLPFTPRYRLGVDANGDGSFRNDVAFVDAAILDPLLADWPCIADQMGTFAERNSCRGPSEHSLNLRLSLQVGQLWGRDARLVFDALDIIEREGGVIDDALILVDPAGSITTSPDGSTVTIPVIANPGFGTVLYPFSRGRSIRIGFRIG